MTDRNASCEQRIGAHMQSRTDYLAGLFAVMDGKVSTFAEDYPDQPEEMTAEDAQERMAELGLGSSVYRVLRVDLSTGGPADYLEAKLSEGPHGWEIVSAAYHFADWFDHAERPIAEDSPLWRYLENIAEIMPSDED